MVWPIGREGGGVEASKEGRDYPPLRGRGPKIARQREPQKAFLNDANSNGESSKEKAHAHLCRGIEYVEKEQVL